MTSEREALARIAALCDEVDPANLDEQPIWPMTVRAIIAEVTPEPGGVEERVPGGALRQVWEVRCDPCGWLPETNTSRDEALTILREHQDEIHD